jgi:general secretion pathway protein G
VEEDDGAVVKLEMAVREFAPPDTGKPRVFLAGAVHIGEKGFYRGLQRFLDGQDVVLFEGVKPPGAGAAEQDVGGGTDEERVAATKRRVRFIAMAVERYRDGHEGKLPPSLRELGEGSEERIAWLLKSSLVDSWGHNFVYSTKEADGSASFDVASLGADGKDGGEGVAADIRFSDQKPLSRPEKGDRSEGLQSKLASSMGLVFQLDAMDHNKGNWRNSDLSVDQVQARLERAGVNADGLFGMLDGSSMFSRFGGFLLGIMGSTPDGKAMLRVMIIEMIGHADQLLDRMPGGMGKVMGVLLEDRNAVVVSDLKKVIQGEPGVKTVGIIYGAGHLPSMERRLVEELGYKPVGDTWRPAITVDAKAAGVSGAQLKATRQMISRMVEAQLPRKKDAGSEARP